MIIIYFLYAPSSRKGINRYPIFLETVVTMTQLYNNIAIMFPNLFDSRYFTFRYFFRLDDPAYHKKY